MQLTTKSISTVPPMEQAQLDRIISVYGGQPACISDDVPTVDGSLTIYLLAENDAGEMVLVNALGGMPLNCLTKSSLKLA